MKTNDELVTELADTIIYQEDGFDPEEYKMGMEVEHEHDDVTGGDPEKIKKIVEAHLDEDPEYYSKLATAIDEE